MRLMDATEEREWRWLVRVGIVVGLGLVLFCGAVA